MGHRLPSYVGICRSPHGHNIKVEAECNAAGFLDFKSISKWLETILKPLDHAMVLHRTDPIVDVYKQDDRFKDFRYVLLSVEPTTEALAQLVMNELSSYCHVTFVTVHETDKYSATCIGVSSDVYRVPPGESK
jgi:6-pyruvoyl-tetrahydropterin synthase